MPYTSHTPWSDHSRNIWWGAQIMKLLFTAFNSSMVKPICITSVAALLELISADSLTD
jgi:hypothetical protein